MVEPCPFVTAGAPSFTVPARGFIHCLYPATADETFIQLPPPPQPSGSLNARTAVVLYLAMEDKTLLCQTEVRSEAVDHSIGTKFMAGL